MFSVDMVLIGASSSQKVEASDFLQFKRAQESAFGNSRTGFVSWTWTCSD
jgi:hypothetical protein